MYARNALSSYLITSPMWLTPSALQTHKKELPWISALQTNLITHSSQNHNSYWLLFCTNTPQDLVTVPGSCHWWNSVIFHSVNHSLRSVWYALSDRLCRSIRPTLGCTKSKANGFLKQHEGMGRAPPLPENGDLSEHELLQQMLSRSHPPTFSL
jgi:hypothetical protein